MHLVERLLWALTLVTTALVGAAALLAWTLRERGLRWTWALAGVPLSLVLAKLSGGLGAAGVVACALAGVVGARWHRADVAAGADHAELALARRGIAEVLREFFKEDLDVGPRRGGRPFVELGLDARGRAVGLRTGGRSGSHTLIVGATGSGKTVSEALIAGRLIEAGLGAVAIDPKGDVQLERRLRAAAERRGVAFYAWSPEGALAYNPYARGSYTEIADRALAGETFTEPHYLRQAQRYLAFAVRALQAAGIAVTPASLARQMDPLELEGTVRELKGELAEQIGDYLDGLGDRARRELGGVRDRLAILAESDARAALVPEEDRAALDLLAAVRERAVVYFRLDADRRVLLSAQLARAVILDLIGLAAELQRAPVATVVLVDEFSAIAAGEVARLFARARAAGLSLVLATQELADLRGADGGGALRDQVLGNVDAVLAHRQSVPESAQLLARVAGTKPVWVTTQRTAGGLFAGVPRGGGTRRREHRDAIDPSQIARLPTGQALLVTPSEPRPPTIVRIHPQRNNPKVV
jgi:hypothetical protein